MHKFLIAAAIVAATAAPSFARANESVPVPEGQTMQMPSLPQDAVAAKEGATEEAPIVEARRMPRRR